VSLILYAEYCIGSLKECAIPAILLQGLLPLVCV
jgi:hypothetical protein